MFCSTKSKSSFQEFIQSKIVYPANLSSFSQKIKEEGKILVTLNGSFDLLHPGHLEMIYDASLLGDVLLLLLNTDDSIKQYKSKNRPINPLEVRLQHIAALEAVGAVSFFGETDPRRVLGEVKPHIHVNGSEYGEHCIEAETVKQHGGKIHIVQLVAGFSSTNLIKKIKNLCD